MASSVYPINIGNSANQNTQYNVCTGQTAGHPAAIQGWSTLG